MGQVSRRLEEQLGAAEQVGIAAITVCWRRVRTRGSGRNSPQREQTWEHMTG
jgi:hypothetical protein